MPSSLFCVPSHLLTSGRYPTLRQIASSSQNNWTHFRDSRNRLTLLVPNRFRGALGGRGSFSRLTAYSSGESMKQLGADDSSDVSVMDGGNTELRVEVGSPHLPAVVRGAKLTLGDQAFFLLAFIACTTSIAFTSLVVAAVPTLYAIGRAATSLSKLADTAREELPSTMAAIRLSGMEISDLTLELSDLSQEIADGVSKSAQAVQAAEAGIRQIGALARQHTISIIQERASLPIISLKPVVKGAAQKTSYAVDQARKTLMNMISRGQSDPENKEIETDKVDS